MEDAPSLILEALAAVIVPVFEKAGESKGIFSSLYLLHSSSSVNYYSLFFSLIFTAVISLTSHPFLAASICFLYEFLQN